MRPHYYPRSTGACRRASSAENFNALQNLYTRTMNERNEAAPAPAFEVSVEERRRLVQEEMRRIEQGADESQKPPAQRGARWGCTLMNTKVTIRAILILLALLVSASAQPQTITGKVVGIVDGDTLDVLDESKQKIRIRLVGIDSPESHQDYGSRAKQSLSDLVFGKTITVTCSKNDRYGRPLSKVLLDGKDINLEQINRGMAWHGSLGNIQGT
jgi:endonuclease YncB( thermonuclease family)